MPGLGKIIEEFVTQCDLPLPIVSVAIGANESIVVMRIFDDGTDVQVEVLWERGRELALPMTVTLIARDGKSVGAVVEHKG